MHKAVLLGVVLLVALALPVQAQFAIGGGATYRGLILGDLSIRIGNLALAVDVGAVAGQEQGATVSAALVSLLLKWHFPLGDFPVTPFLGGGAAAAGIGVSASSGGQSASVTGIGVGGQFAGGAELQLLGMPLYLNAAVHYSTVDKVTVRFEAGGQVAEQEVPVTGVGGFSFSVGLRFDFISIGGAKPDEEASGS